MIIYIYMYLFIFCLWEGLVLALYMGPIWVRSEESF